MQSLKEKIHEKVVFENEKNEENLGGVDNEIENNIILLRNHQTTNTLIVPEFAISISEAKKRIIMLQNFVKEILIPDTDFGIIPGCKKPSLFKSGAEKLAEIFGFSKHVEVTSRLEDWKNQIFHYEVKATLKNKRTGLIEAEGIGSCNSKEKRYASQDACNIVNSILKMAKKRAIIDAVLSATRTSGIFGQDMEDIQNVADEESFNSQPKRSKASKATENPSSHLEAQAQPDVFNDVNSSNAKLITKNQQSLIITLVSKKFITVPEVRQIISTKYGVSESKNLSSAQASDFIKYLNSLNNKAYGG